MAESNDSVSVDLGTIYLGGKVLSSTYPFRILIAILASWNYKTGVFVSGCILIFAWILLISSDWEDYVDECYGFVIHYQGIVRFNWFVIMNEIFFWKNVMVCWKFLCLWIIPGIFSLQSYLLLLLYSLFFVLFSFHSFCIKEEKLQLFLFTFNPFLFND